MDGFDVDALRDRSLSRRDVDFDESLLINLSNMLFCWFCGFGEDLFCGKSPVQKDCRLSTDMAILFVRSCPREGASQYRVTRQAV